VRLLLAGGNEGLRRSMVETLEPAHDVRLAGDALDAAAGCEVAIVVDRSVVVPLGDGRGGKPGSTHPAIDAAARHGVRRLIHISCREMRVSFPREWLAIHTAPVYGIGDDPVTIFLIMMRSLPTVPILSETHMMQPLWHQDLARAVASAVSLPASDLGRVIHIAGPDRVTQRELYERIAAMIDRHPLRIPIPDFLAKYGARLAEALRTPVPLESSHLAFAERADAEPGPRNELTSLLDVPPTPLDEGLKSLINGLDELTPFDGVGALEVKRFSADIRGSRHGAADLLHLFRSRFKDVMPVEIGAEPASPQIQLIEGAVVTITLPGRGHVQIRVEEVGDRHVVVSTLRGHALAGIVRFSTRELDNGDVQFEVMTCDTAANALDWIVLTLGGARIQDANWTKVVQNVVHFSGGTADDVQTDARKLAGEEAANVQRWIEALVVRRKARSA
jgi:NADH dehydrogenase